MFLSIFSINECKLFLAKNAKEKNIPSDNWKCASHKSTDEGYIKNFEHTEGYRISILEEKKSKSLKILNIEKDESLLNNVLGDHELTDKDFSKMPMNVKLFINTLRSLQGDYPLESELFDSKYQDLWEHTIRERGSQGCDNLPNIMLFDSEKSDDIFQVLNQNADSFYMEDNVLKYVGSYFWFAFATDSIDSDENPELLVTPKGFWDDGRVPLPFSNYMADNEIVKNLSEIQESTLEFESKIEDPLERTVKAYRKMKDIGIDFSMILQSYCSEHFDNSGHVFTDDEWVKENLEDYEK